MNTKYLVTGAAGHLGNRMIRQLAREGKSVRALILPGDPLARYLPQGESEWREMSGK